MRHFLPFILLVSISPVFSQQRWEKTYGGNFWDRGFSVQQTVDGGYIVVGFTIPLGVNDDTTYVYLIKTDSFGDTIWTRSFSRGIFNIGSSVQQTFDGSYIIAGFTALRRNSSNDVYLVKTDANGDTIWTRRYGGTENEFGYSVQQTADGGYIIAGFTESFGAGGVDVFLVKTDANGDTIWTRRYGGTENEFGYSVQQTADGGYIIAGFTNSFGAGMRDVYLIKTDSLGDTLWTRTYGGATGDEGWSVQQTADGGYIIAGWKGDTLDNPDVYLIKTDSLGLVYTGVEEQVTKPLPNLLLDVSPNPFTKTATIRYQLPSATPVRILAFDITGRTVATIFDQDQPAGTRQLFWQPEGLAQGVYFITLETTSLQLTQRILLLR